MAAHCKTTLGVTWLSTVKYSGAHMADHCKTTLGFTWLTTVQLHCGSHGYPLYNYTNGHYMAVHNINLH